MNQKYLRILIILALLGAGVSAVILQQHYDYIEKSYEGGSFCSINEYVDCKAIDASAYSSFFSVPVGGLALVFYIVLTIFLFGGIRNPQKNISGVMFGFYLSILSLGVTLFMAFMSFAVIKLLCILCLALYIINITIVVVYFGALQISVGDFFEKTKSYVAGIFTSNSALGFKVNFLKHSLVGILVLLCGVFVFNQMRQAALKKSEARQKVLTSLKTEGKQPKITEEDLVKIHFTQAPLPIPLEGHPTIGGASAKVHIVEFSDFQCPYCAKAAKYFKPLIKTLGDDVSFHFINYPLDQACNPNIQRKFHENACLAASAAMCADNQGKFWEMHDRIFENQTKISKENLKSLADEVGLNSGLFEKCLDSEEIKRVLKKDIDLATQIEIHGTPSVFINGRSLQGWTSESLVKKVVEENIKRLSKN